MALTNILILPSWYPSPQRPLAGVFVQEQAQVLARAHRVSVLVPGVRTWRQMLRGTAGPRIEDKDQNGIRVFRQSAATVLPRSESSGYAAYYRAARSGLERVMGTWGRPDIIHAHVVLPAGWAAARLGRLYSIPVVLNEYSGPFTMHLGNKHKRRMAHYALSHVRRVVACSPGQSKEIQGFLRESKVEVVGNLVLTDFFVPARPEMVSPTPTTLALSIGNLVEVKGFSYLIQAAGLLLKRGVGSFRLVIGGDGPLRARLQELANSQGLSECCVFLGSLNRTEVRNWMQKCDVFVLASLHETFGIVLGEAMACGKPVIATRCYGPEFIVTPETGLLAEVADPVSLADSMEAFITGRAKFDPAVIRQSVVERFGEATFLDRMSALYDGVLGERN